MRGWLVVTLLFISPPFPLYNNIHDDCIVTGCEDTALGACLCFRREKEICLKPRTPSSF